jgi:hypothetical protein
MQRIQRLADQFGALLPAHGSLEAVPLSVDLLDELADGVASILSGECVGVEESTFAGKGLRCDFGSCSVLYRAGRL